jgi:hypothetical protein
MDLTLQNFFEGNMVRENLALLMEEGRVIEDKGWFIQNF